MEEDNLNYTPTEWKDRTVQYPNRYHMTPVTDEFDTYELTEAVGQVLNNGTPVRAEYMNNIETGIKKVTERVNTKANKEEVNTSLNTKANKKKTGTLKLSVANWTAQAPYTQTINVADILETDVVNIYPVYSTVIETRAIEREDYSKLSMVTSANSSLTFTCDEEVPTVDLNLRYEVTY